MRVELTPDFIAHGLVCPPGMKRIEYVCSSGIGLYIEVKNRLGAGTGEIKQNRLCGVAYLRYKNKDGKTCHQKIGSTDVLTLADIRREAKRIKAEITLGADPRAEAKAKKAVITYDDFFQNHYLPHAKLHKRSWDRDEELYRLRIKEPFGDKRLNVLSRHSIQKFHASLAEQGLRPATANHHLKLLRQSLNLARQWGLLQGDNPASGVTMLPEENKIERYMNEEELGRLLQVLRTDRNRSVCNVALFLLSTGCRLNEALSATWADVNVENRVFTVRATNSKSRKIRSVPLNDSAIEVLNGLGTEDGSGALFVSSRTKEGLTTIAKQWDRIRCLADLPNLRLHDLRHQFASHLVNAGQSIYTLSAILGHSTVKVTERYAHLSTKTLQEAAASGSLPPGPSAGSAR